MANINLIQINCVAIVLLLSAVVNGKHIVHVYIGHYTYNNTCSGSLCMYIFLIKLYAFDFISITARSHGRGSGQY